MLPGACIPLPSSKKQKIKSSVFGPLPMWMTARRAGQLALLAAAVLPCTAFFTSSVHTGQLAATTPRGVHASLCRAHAPSVRVGVLGLVSAEGAPRRPPPPPPKQAAPGAAGASHTKIKDPQLEAGAWRGELGLGLNRMSASTSGTGAQEQRVSRASSQGKEKMKKLKRAAAPPPPMLCKAQWEAAAEIGGAWNIKELGQQYELAVKGEFVALELDWRRKMASNAEIAKRLRNAAKVQKMATEQEEKAKSPDASKEDTWALQKKMAKPPKGLMFRYLEKAKKDGRVQAMSAPRTEGHSANVEEVRHDRLERKLLSLSRGGSDNQRLLSAEQKRGLTTPAERALKALPAAMRKGIGANVHPRLLAQGSPRAGGDGKGSKRKATKSAKSRQARDSRPARAATDDTEPEEMSFLDSLNSY